MVRSRVVERNLIRSLTVYQPATPLRAVEVWAEEAGEPLLTELTVVGCSAKIVRSYEGPENLLPPATHRELIDAGYRFCHEREDHDVLIWDDDLGCPRTFQEETDYIVVGPAARPEEWWREQIARKVERQRHRKVREARRGMVEASEKGI